MDNKPAMVYGLPSIVALLHKLPARLYPPLD